MAKKNGKNGKYVEKALLGENGGLTKKIGNYFSEKEKKKLIGDIAEDPERYIEKFDRQAKIYHKISNKYDRMSETYKNKAKEAYKSNDISKFKVYGSKSKQYKQLSEFYGQQATSFELRGLAAELVKGVKEMRQGEIDIQKFDEAIKDMLGSINIPIAVGDIDGVQYSQQSLLEQINETLSQDILTDGEDMPEYLSEIISEVQKETKKEEEEKEEVRRIVEG